LPRPTRPLLGVANRHRFDGVGDEVSERLNRRLRPQKLAPPGAPLVEAMYLVLVLAASVSVLSACGSSSDPATGLSAENGVTTTIVDRHRRGRDGPHPPGHPQL